MDTDWLEALLKKHERDNQIVKVIGVEYENAVAKGENHRSLAQRAKIQVRLGNGRKSTKSAIVKNQLKWKTWEFDEESKQFKYEIKTYLDVLNQMEVLMEEFSDRRGMLWGIMYGYNPHDLLILQDLSEDGYILADRKRGLDLEHGLVVMRDLGRFHAMSRILLDRHTLAKEDFRMYYPSRANSPSIINQFEDNLWDMGKAMIDLWPPKWKEFGHRIQKITQFSCEKLQTLLENKENHGLEVFNHGDLWTTNIMFKYNETTKQPLTVKFIDFQVSHVNSYIWDIIYFTHTSIRGEIRRSKMTELTSAYIESLRSTLSTYNYEGPVPTLQDLNRELERVAYYRLIILTTVTPIATAVTDNPIRHVQSDDGTGMKESLNPVDLSSPSLIENIGPDLEYFAEIGML